MNWQRVIRTLGTVVCSESLMLIVPMLIALSCGENWQAILISALIAAAIGLLCFVVRPNNNPIYAKEGIFIVASSWIVISAIGALPFFIDGAIPNYIDALFESVSGFSTTGSSILTDVESLPRGLAFWRSFTHWVGGMGVLVFVIAIVPQTNTNTMHVMRAEVPGPIVSKVLPRARESALLLYGIYVVMTAIEVVLLFAGGMPLFDSVLNSFATAGTGGFAIKNSSIAAYNSPYVEYVIGIFMMLFGVNFNIYYFILLRRMGRIFKDEELRTYLTIIAASTLVITLNLLERYDNFWYAFRTAFFQVASVITTTGFCTDDFNLWPTMSKIILFSLMFIGASGGSTGGGIKVSRIIIMMKKIWQDLTKMLRPNAVTTVRLDGRKVEDGAVTATMTFFAAYMIFAALGIFIVSFDNFDFETTVSSVVACIGNIGPGFGKVGAAGNFSAMSDLSKLTLSFEMLLGRLEIFPLVMFFSPRMYKKL